MRKLSYQSGFSSSKIQGNNLILKDTPTREITRRHRAYKACTVVIQIILGIASTSISQVQAADQQNSITRSAITNNSVEDTEKKDSTEDAPSLDLAWISWNESLFNLICGRSEQFSDRLLVLPQDSDRPTSITIQCEITCEGQVKNIETTKKCANFVDNVLAVSLIKSIAGSANLGFPKDSRKKSVRVVFNFYARNAAPHFIPTKNLEEFLHGDDTIYNGLDIKPRIER